MGIQELKSTLKQLKEYFPEPVQKFGTQVWKDIELPLGSLVERRRLLESHQVVWPHAEVADFNQMQLLGPTANDALIEVAYTLVSPGTERAQFLSLPGTVNLDGFSLYQPGYSGSGVVKSVGKNISTIAPGDRVAGRITHQTPAVVAEEFLFHIPSHVKLEDAAFIELGIIVQQGIRKARIQPGESVVVIGQGLIGQLANRLCRVAGAAPLVAVARSDAKAAEALNNGGADKFMTVDEIMADPTRYDVVIEATGDVNIMPFAASLVADDQRVIGMGTPRGVGPFHLGQADGGANQRIIGGHISGMPKTDQTPGRWTYRSEGLLFMDLLARGQIVVSDLISERLNPTEATEFYESLAHNQTKSIGVIFDWRQY